jgi:hypothetical protein
MTRCRRCGIWTPDRRSPRHRDAGAGGSGHGDVGGAGAGVHARTSANFETDCDMRRVRCWRGVLVKSLALSKRVAKQGGCEL